MEKRFDYYAGYPGQQATPKWVGVTLGSLFGGMLLVAVGVGVHVLAPARSAQASTAPAITQSPVAPPVVAPKVDAPAPVVAEAAEPVHASRHHHGHASHAAKKGTSKVVVAKTDARYKKAQLYAKSVSKRDKKSRDELDRLLGL